MSHFIDSPFQVSERDIIEKCETTVDDSEYNKEKCETTVDDSEYNKEKCETTVDDSEVNKNKGNEETFNIVVGSNDIRVV